MTGLLIDVNRIYRKAEESNESLNKMAQHLSEQTLLAQKMAEQANAANRSKSEFFANMSHEILNPMSAILGYSEFVLENTTDKKNAEGVKIIQKNGEYLLSIVNDILDLSKMEAGRLDMEKTRCSPVQVVSEVLTLMEPRSSSKGLSINVEFEGEIPQYIQTDPVRLRQVLINLISNGIEFTDVGGVRIFVRLLRQVCGNSLLEFEIIDTGIGLTDEQRGRLFEPFSQGDSSVTRKSGSTGLGLAICHRLVVMLGGEVSVESVTGKGSNFSFTISTGPLDDVDLIENVDLGEELNASTEDDGNQVYEAESQVECRVLLAEDCRDNQKLIAYILKKNGVDVSIAENGQVAVDMVHEAELIGRGYDVILMDIQMPILDGYAATKLLREQGFANPIIALTAHAMSEDRQKCIDAGCDDFATKPVDRHRLASLIAASISKRDDLIVQT